MSQDDRTLPLFDDAALPAAVAPAAPAPVDSPDDLATTLRSWQAAGWLRRLDLALAAFIAELEPAAPPALLLATALLANLEGQGHTCLPLAELIDDPAGLLGWPAPALQALAALRRQLPADAAGWRGALQASRTVRDAGGTPDAGQPLVLVRDDDGDRLYLRRYWDHEVALAEQLNWRSLGPQHGPVVDEAAARSWLDRLFPTPAAGSTATPLDPVDWQKLACAIALRGGLSLITGGPGTGKTYTAARLLALLLAVSPQPDQLRVALAAPTGKAAARLKQAIDASLAQLPAAQAPGEPDFAALTRRIGPARTLHALLGARPDTRALRHHAGHPLDLDVLIVDEASMIHLEMMAALLDALPPHARLVLLGDKDQLASVEAGAVLGDLCRDAAAGGYDADTVRFAQAVAGITVPPEYRAGSTPRALAQRRVMLRQSRRFGGPIGQLALAVNRGDPMAARALLADPGADCGGALAAHQPATPDTVLHLARQGRPGAEGGFQPYLRRLAERPAPGDSDAHAAAHARWVHAVLADFDRFRVLTAVRDGDWGAAGLNRAIQQALAREGWLRPTGEWFVGRPVMVTRNDTALGVFNGDIGIVLPTARSGTAGETGNGPALRVWFADGGEALRSVSVSRLPAVETAFAMTVHKSQGSEFEHTVLVLPAHAGALLSRELVYTGITRARSAFTLVSEQPGTLDAAIAQPTRRASGLRWRLQRAAD